MRVLALPGPALHWREDGDADGTPVAFVNSLGTDLRVWDDVVARLPEGHRCIRHDVRGHGLSGCPSGPYSIDDLTGDLEALLEHLGVGRCAVVGLSIGGLVGQRLAARRPDLVGALVLSNTAARIGEPAMWKERIAAIRANGIESVADAVLERWFAPGFRASDAALAWRHMLVRTPLEGYLACCAAIAGADLSEATAALTLPVLGIAGEHDGSTPVETVRATIDSIAGARLHVVGRCSAPAVRRAPGRVRAGARRLSRGDHDERERRTRERGRGRA